LEMPRVAVQASVSDAALRAMTKPVVVPKMIKSLLMTGTPR